MTSGRTSIAKRAVAAGLAAAVFSSQAGAARAEGLFWEERRRAAARQSSTETARAESVAQLPGTGALLDAPMGRVLSALPGAGPRAGNWPWLSELAAPFGEVRAAVPAPRPGAPLVILVQDVHAQEEAQRNISGLLRTLHEQKGVSLIGLEGAAGPFDLHPYRDFPDGKLATDLADAFLREDLIGGAEHAAWTAKTAPTLWGVEDPALYLAHIRAFKEGLPRQESLRASIAAWRGPLADLKKKTYAPALLALDAQAADFRAGRGGLGAYLAGLADAAGAVERFPNVRLFLKAWAAEKSLDFGAAEKERRRLVETLARALPPAALTALAEESLRFRQGLLGAGPFHARLRELCRRSGLGWENFPQMDRYVDYVLLAGRVDAAALWEETRALESAAWAARTRTPAQRELRAWDEDLAAVDKAVSFSMTPAEWARYDARRREIAALPARWEKLAGAPPPAGEDWAGGLAPFEAFCRAGLARNAAFTDNLLAQMKARGAPAAALLVGGFHTEGLAALLKARGAACAVATPRLSQVEGGARYLDLLSRGTTPLEDLFLPEKITLKPPVKTAVTDTAGFDGAGLSRTHAALEEALGPGDGDAAALEIIRAHRGVGGVSAVRLPDISHVTIVDHALVMRVEIAAFKPAETFPPAVEALRRMARAQELTVGDRRVVIAPEEASAARGLRAGLLARWRQGREKILSAVPPPAADAFRAIARLAPGGLAFFFPWTWLYARAAERGSRWAVPLAMTGGFLEETLIRPRALTMIAAWFPLHGLGPWAPWGHLALYAIFFSTVIHLTVLKGRGAVFQRAEWKDRAVLFSLALVLGAVQGGLRHFAVLGVLPTSLTDPFWVLGLFHAFYNPVAIALGWPLAMAGWVPRKMSRGTGRFLTPPAAAKFLRHLDHLLKNEGLQKRGLLSVPEYQALKQGPIAIKEAAALLERIHAAGLLDEVDRFIADGGTRERIGLSKNDDRSLREGRISPERAAETSERIRAARALDEVESFLADGGTKERIRLPKSTYRLLKQGRISLKMAAALAERIGKARPILRRLDLLGTNIKKLKTERGVTYETIALKLELDRESVLKLSRGEHRGWDLEERLPQLERRLGALKRETPPVIKEAQRRWKFKVDDRGYIEGNDVARLAEAVETFIDQGGTPGELDLRDYRADLEKRNPVHWRVADRLWKALDEKSAAPSRKQRAQALATNLEDVLETRKLVTVTAFADKARVSDETLRRVRDEGIVSEDSLERIEGAVASILADASQWQSSKDAELLRRNDLLREGVRTLLKTKMAQPEAGLVVKRSQSFVSKFLSGGRSFEDKDLAAAGAAVTRTLRKRVETAEEPLKSEALRMADALEKDIPPAENPDGALAEDLLRLFVKTAFLREDPWTRADSRRTKRLAAFAWRGRALPLPPQTLWTDLLSEFRPVSEYLPAVSNGHNVKLVNEDLRLLHRALSLYFSGKGGNDPFGNSRQVRFVLNKFQTSAGHEAFSKALGSVRPTGRPRLGLSGWALRLAGHRGDGPVAEKHAARARLYEDLAFSGPLFFLSVLPWALTVFGHPELVPAGAAVAAIRLVAYAVSNIVFAAIHGRVYYRDEDGRIAWRPLEKGDRAAFFGMGAVFRAPFLMAWILDAVVPEATFLQGLVLPAFAALFSWGLHKLQNAVGAQRWGGRMGMASHEDEGAEAAASPSETEYFPPAPSRNGDEMISLSEMARRSDVPRVTLLRRVKSGHVIADDVETLPNGVRSYLFRSSRADEMAAALGSPPQGMWTAHEMADNADIGYSTLMKALSEGRVAADKTVLRAGEPRYFFLPVRKTALQQQLSPPEAEGMIAAQQAAEMVGMSRGSFMRAIAAGDIKPDLQILRGEKPRHLFRRSTLARISDQLKREAAPAPEPAAEKTPVEKGMITAPKMAARAGLSYKSLIRAMTRGNIQADAVEKGDGMTRYFFLPGRAQEIAGAVSSPQPREKTPRRKPSRQDGRRRWLSAAAFAAATGLSYRAVMRALWRGDVQADKTAPRKGMTRYFFRKATAADTAQKIFGIPSYNELQKGLAEGIETVWSKETGTVATDKEAAAAREALRFLLERKWPLERMGVTKEARRKLLDGRPVHPATVGAARKTAARALVEILIGERRASIASVAALTRMSADDIQDVLMGAAEPHRTGAVLPLLLKQTKGGPGINPPAAKAPSPRKEDAPLESSDDTEHLTRYLREMRKNPIPTSAENKTVAREYRETKDPAVAMRLVENNLPLVVHIAKQYRRRYAGDFNDLIQEGNIGLIRAVREKYDPDRAALSTYASHWIHEAIRSFILTDARLVQITRGSHEGLAFVKGRIDRHEVSFDHPLGNEDESRTLHGVVPDGKMTPADQLYEGTEAVDIVEKETASFLRTLSPQKALVFRERILSQDPPTLKEIGARLEVTRERVRQIEEELFKDFSARLAPAVDADLPDADAAYAAFKSWQQKKFLGLSGWSLRLAGHRGGPVPDAVAQRALLLEEVVHAGFFMNVLAPVLPYALSAVFAVLGVPHLVPPADLRLGSHLFAFALSNVLYGFSHANFLRRVGDDVLVEEETSFADKVRFSLLGAAFRAGYLIPGWGGAGSFLLAHFLHHAWNNLVPASWFRRAGEFIGSPWLAGGPLGTTAEGTEAGGDARLMAYLQRLLEGKDMTESALALDGLSFETETTAAGRIRFGLRDGKPVQAKIAGAKVPVYVTASLLAAGDPSQGIALRFDTSAETFYYAFKTEPGYLRPVAAPGPRELLAYIDALAGAPDLSKPALALKPFRARINGEGLLYFGRTEARAAAHIRASSHLGEDVDVVPVLKDPEDPSRGARLEIRASGDLWRYEIIGTPNHFSKVREPNEPKPQKPVDEKKRQAQGDRGKFLRHIETLRAGGDAEASARALAGSPFAFTTIKGGFLRFGEVNRAPAQVKVSDEVVPVRVTALWSDPEAPEKGLQLEISTSQKTLYYEFKTEPGYLRPREEPGRQEAIEYIQALQRGDSEKVGEAALALRPFSARVTDQARLYFGYLNGRQMEFHLHSHPGAFVAVVPHLIDPDDPSRGAYLKITAEDRTWRRDFKPDGHYFAKRVNALDEQQEAKHPQEVFLQRASEAARALLKISYLNGEALESLALQTHVPAAVLREFLWGETPLRETDLVSLWSRGLSKAAADPVDAAGMRRHGSLNAESAAENQAAAQKILRLFLQNSLAKTRPERNGISPTLLNALRRFTDGADAEAFWRTLEERSGRRREASRRIVTKAAPFEEKKILREAPPSQKRVDRTKEYPAMINFFRRALEVTPGELGRSVDPRLSGAEVRDVEEDRFPRPLTDQEWSDLLSGLANLCEARLIVALESVGYKYLPDSMAALAKKKFLEDPSDFDFFEMSVAALRRAREISLKKTEDQAQRMARKVERAEKRGGKIRGKKILAAEALSVHGVASIPWDRRPLAALLPEKLVRLKEAETVNREGTTVLLDAGLDGKTLAWMAGSPEASLENLEKAPNPRDTERGLRAALVRFSSVDILAGESLKALLGRATENALPEERASLWKAARSSQATTGPKALLAGFLDRYFSKDRGPEPGWENTADLWRALHEIALKRPVAVPAVVLQPSEAPFNILSHAAVSAASLLLSLGAAFLLKGLPIHVAFTGLLLLVGPGISLRYGGMAVRVARELRRARPELTETEWETVETATKSYLELRAPGEAVTAQIVDDGWLSRWTAARTRGRTVDLPLGLAQAIRDDLHLYGRIRSGWIRDVLDHEGGRLRGEPSPRIFLDKLLSRPSSPESAGAPTARVETAGVRLELVPPLRRPASQISDRIVISLSLASVRVSPEERLKPYLSDTERIEFRDRLRADARAAAFNETPGHVLSLAAEPHRTGLLPADVVDGGTVGELQSYMDVYNRARHTMTSARAVAAFFRALARAVQRSFGRPLLEVFHAPTVAVDGEWRLSDDDASRAWLSRLAASARRAARSGGKEGVSVLLDFDTPQLRAHLEAALAREGLSPAEWSRAQWPGLGFLSRSGVGDERGLIRAEAIWEKAAAPGRAPLMDIYTLREDEWSLADLRAGIARVLVVWAGGLVDATKSLADEIEGIRHVLIQA